MSREKEQFQQEFLIRSSERELLSRKNIFSDWKYILRNILHCKFYSVLCECSGRQRQESCQQYKFSMNLPRERRRQASPLDKFRDSGKPSAEPVF
jgi:hypothetical protein